MKEKHCSDRVVQYILTRDNRELGELTILKVANSLNISESYLYDSFRTRKKMQPGRFLVMVKMMRAAKLLELKRYNSIKVLSRELGFASSDYFSKIFKEHYGTTPGKYRQYIRARNNPEIQSQLP